MNYRSDITDIDAVTKKIKVSIPVEMVAREVETVMNDLVRTAQVKGFRPGKAPRHIVEQLHGERVHFEVANRLISSSLREVVTQNKLDMIGNPEIDVSEFKPGTEIEYTANVEIFPVPEIKGYDKISVEVQKRSVTPAHIDEILERMRKSKSSPKKLEFRNKAQSGDVIDASLVMTVEGEETSRPEPLVVVLGEKNLPDDLEAGIVGMEVGETKEILSKFPEDHPNESLRNKEAKCVVTLNVLSERVLPELDDEFAKTINPETPTLLGLRLEISKELEKQNEAETKGDIHAAILDALLVKNEFQVPQSLMDDEIRVLLMKTGLVDPKKVDVTQVSMEPFRKELGDTAQKRVRTAIIVDRIGEAEKLAAKDEDIEQAFEKLATDSGVSKEEVKKFYYDKDRLVRFVLDVTRNKVLEYLVGKTKVEFVEKLPENKEQDKAGNT